MTDIMPCPFCSETEMLRVDSKEDNSWIVCDGCGAHGPRVHVKSGSEDEYRAAAYSWDQRISAPKQYLP